MNPRERAQWQRALDEARKALATARQAARRFGRRPGWEQQAEGARGAVTRLEQVVADMEAKLEVAGR